MAVSGAIKAGRAYVEFFGEKSLLIRDMKSIKKTLQTWGGQVTGIGKGVMAAGLAMTAPFVAAAKVFADMGSDMVDLSARTGASVEALSTLGFAASQTGAGMEDVEKAMKFLQKSGLAAGMNTEEGFRAALRSIAALEDPMDRTQLALKMFGKAGTALIPMAMEFATLEERARALGLEMSGNDAKAADALGDAWGELWAVAKMGVFQVGAALAPLLTTITEGIVRCAAWTMKWVSANRELVMMAALVAAAVVAVGIAITGLGITLTLLGAAIGVVMTALTALGAVMGAVLGALAFLATPLGLIVVALTAGVAAWALWTESGQAAVSFISGVLSGLWAHVKTTFQGIKDALAAGDLALAAQVLWNSLKVIWLEGTTFLNTQWENFLVALVDGAVSLAKRVTDIFVDMAIGIGNAMLSIEGFISKVLGKDLLDPTTRKALGIALPFIGAAAKPVISGGLDSFNASFKDNAAADIAAAQAALAEAKAGFASAVGAAKVAAEAPPEINKLAGLQPTLGDVKTTVAGTFSAAAVGGIGGSKTFDEINENTKQSAKFLKKIAQGGTGVAVI